MIRDPSDGSVKQKLDGDVVARANARKQMIAAGPAMTGTSEDTTQGDRPAATVKVRPSSANNWGMKSLDQPPKTPKPAPTIDQLRDHYAKHNLGFQPKEQE